MEPVRVGMREFRDKLAAYLLESDTPLAITRHGDTVGYYLPARRKRREVERASLREAALRLREMMASEGITEDQVLEDFREWRAVRKQ